MRLRFRQYLIRNLHGMDHFEVFMVTAIATILAIRLFLELTGYPQIGSSTLHIAHAVWGGLLMAAAIIAQQVSLTKRIETFTALVGGAGFGLFIDEVGKFVTQSNDYFFQPSVAIMYVTFVSFYLAARSLMSYAGATEIEYLVNALKDMQSIPGGRLQEPERREILYLLERCDPSNPLVRDLREITGSAYASPTGEPGLYRRLRSRLTDWYRRVANSRWFKPTVTFFFVAQLIGGIGMMIALMFAPGEVLGQLDDFTFADWAILASNIISAFFIAWGVLLLWRSRLRAYIMFQRSVLVVIFIGQFFLFYKDEFGALSGLVFDLLLYVALRFMIDREREVEFQKSAA